MSFRFYAALLSACALLLALVPGLLHYRIYGGREGAAPVVGRESKLVAAARRAASFSIPAARRPAPLLLPATSSSVGSGSVAASSSATSATRAAGVDTVASVSPRLLLLQPAEEETNGGEEQPQRNESTGDDGEVDAPADAVIGDPSLSNEIDAIRQRVSAARSSAADDVKKGGGGVEAPLKTHTSCQVFADGFSLCYYENACFKLNSKEVGFLGGSSVIHPRLPAPTTGAWDDAGTSALEFADWVPERPSAVESRAAIDRYMEYANLEQVDFTYKDTTAVDVAFRPLLVPLQHIREGVARPTAMWESVSRPPQLDDAEGDVDEGGAGEADPEGGSNRLEGEGAWGRKKREGPGRGRGVGGPHKQSSPRAPVTKERLRQSLETKGCLWVRNLYVVSATYAFKRHLWALGATTSFPLFSALALNASLHLGLPPLDFVLVSTEMRPAVAAPGLQERFGWNGELLASLLEAATGHEALTGTRAQEDGVLFTSAAGILRKSAPNPIILSQPDDLPGVEAGAAAAGSAAPPPAICAARAVLLGHKPSFVGGPAEANALRYLLQTPLRLSFPFPSAAEVSGKRVRLLFLDREASDRPFTNPGELRAVLDAYKVDYTYVDGESYAVLSFAEQASLFNAHQIVVAAHGAALSNLIFSPPRSVLIEVFPRGVWKPTYARLASNMGHSHLPLFSFINGGPRHPHAPYVPQVDTKACSARSYPRVTRDNCYPWLRALPVYVPKDAFEQALLAALNLATYDRVEPTGKGRKRPKFAPAVYKNKEGA